MLIFSTIIAYGVEITPKATNHRYDPGANLQGQIYLESTDRYMNSTYFDKGVSYFYNDCLCMLFIFEH